MRTEFKVGDRLIRNKLKLASLYDTDPRIIKLIDVANMRNGDKLNGFKIKDIFTGKIEVASTEYLECYYELDQRKEKLKKINESNL